MAGRRHTYPEAAEVLRVKEKWLRRNIKRLPHSKKGDIVTFSDADLDAIDAMFHHDPRATRPKAEGSGAHPMAHLVPLPSRGSAAHSG